MLGAEGGEGQPFPTPIFDAIYEFYGAIQMSDDKTSTAETVGGCIGCVILVFIGFLVITNCVMDDEPNSKEGNAKSSAPAKTENAKAPPFKPYVPLASESESLKQLKLDVKSLKDLYNNEVTREVAKKDIKNFKQQLQFPAESFIGTIVKITKSSISLNYQNMSFDLVYKYDGNDETTVECLYFGKAGDIITWSGTLTDEGSFTDKGFLDEPEWSGAIASCNNPYSKSRFELADYDSILPKDYESVAEILSFATNLDTKQSVANGLNPLISQFITNNNVEYFGDDLFSQIKSEKAVFTNFNDFNKFFTILRSHFGGGSFTKGNTYREKAINILSEKILDDVSIENFDLVIDSVIIKKYEVDNQLVGDLAEISPLAGLIGGLVETGRNAAHKDTIEIIASNNNIKFKLPSILADSDIVRYVGTLKKGDKIKLSGYIAGWTAEASPTYYIYHGALLSTDKFSDISLK
jgi:hypothetical protein